MTTFDIENSAFESKRMGDTVILKYKENAFALFLDVGIRNEYLKLVEAIKDSKEIKGSVTINAPDFDDEAGFQTLLELVCGGSDSGSFDSRFKSETVISKFRDTIGKRMLSNIAMTKPQVVGVQGDATSEYLGLILCNDARFATPDTRFIFKNASWGLPVSPGLSYFLPRFIGQGKALEFIHHSKELTAEEALSLGLITDIVTHDQLQDRCLKEVEMLSNEPANVAVVNRMLVNPDVSELERYLERYYSAVVKSGYKLYGHKPLK